MAFDISDTLDQVLSHAAASAHCDAWSLGEPITPPAGQRLHAAVYMRDTDTVSLYLDGGTLEVHNVILRLYRPVLREPIANSERELAQAASDLRQDLVEDFTLGAKVREIDVAGAIGGEGLGTEWGHVVIDNVMFRIVDIRIPIVVDDSATAAP